MVSFRPYEDADAAAVAALLEESAPPIYRWKLHALHGPGRDEPSRWRTEVALDPDGEIVGAVTAAHHSVHRGQYVLAVTVAPDRRRQGLGRELVAEGLRMRTEPLPMVFEFLGTDPASAALMRSVGGEIVQTAPGFRMDPARMREWAGAQSVPPGTVVGDLTGASAAELTDSCRDRYVWQHEGWCALPIAVPRVTAHAEWTVTAARRELSSGAWVDGRLAAHAVVFDEPGGTLSLISETSSRDEPNGTELVAAVIADALRRLADAGIAEIEFDGHVTDPHLHPVTQTFPAGLHTSPFHVARLP